jgi:hypothetical protein
VPGTAPENRAGGMGAFRRTLAGKEWLGKTPGLRKPVSGWRCRAARLPGVRRAAAIRDARVPALHHGFLDPDAVRQRRGGAWSRRAGAALPYYRQQSARSFPELKESSARLTNIMTTQAAGRYAASWIGVIA